MSRPERLNERELRAWRGFLIMQEDIRRHMNRHLVGEAGISLADFSILSVLRLTPDRPMRVFELIDTLRWEKTRIIHQISRMVRRGLVERQAAADDARGTNIALTAEGRAVIDQALPLHVLHVRRLFFDVLTPDQLDTLAAMSETVLDNLRDEPFDE
ncbi:MarR family winged helix-turn-helix transcriptional regulator [Paractinoplanes brasiliensis]|uniref:MarR family transcriptional regulator n=1 Tax=Paractinoplanes brasiliensis TaxID=52695 RepID=A0A4R6JQX9_9ACTN|nr:MarR family winged helix-turn-helix transcriptional regulator [Actinoplanes brasiliensis]TDO37045.1 MarR family transcriptional regulator [Actinoplanes brasiliensis]GID32261.1 MarR family transcriptional regulator [Actinoplanes brasiliensis]